MSTVFLGYCEEDTIKCNEVSGVLGFSKSSEVSTDSETPEEDESLFLALLRYARAGNLPEHPAVVKLAVDTGETDIIKKISFSGVFKYFDNSVDFRVSGIIGNPKMWKTGGSKDFTNRGDFGDSKNSPVFTIGGIIENSKTPDTPEIVVFLKDKTWHVLDGGKVTKLSEYKTPEEREEIAFRKDLRKFSKPYRITTVEEMTDFQLFLQRVAEEDQVRIEFSYGYPKLTTETFDFIEDYLKVANTKGSSVGSIVQVEYTNEPDFEGWDELIAVVMIIAGFREIPKTSNTPLLVESLDCPETVETPGDPESPKIPQASLDLEVFGIPKTPRPVSSWGTREDRKFPKFSKSPV